MITGSNEFEQWWKRYWGARGKYGERLRKEIALAAWNEARAEVSILRAELINIANALPMRWDDFPKEDRLHQFKEWAQNRARHALARHALSKVSP